MKITFEIKKRYVAIFLSLILIVSFGIYVVAQTIPNPGHSWKEMTKDFNLTVDTANGRVGIGTTSPGSKLEVSNGNLIVDSSSGESWFTRGNSVYFYIEPYNDQNAQYVRLGAYYTGNQGARDLILQDVGGRVGIGIRTPQKRLQVHDGGESGVLFTSTLSGGTATDGLFVGINNNGLDTSIWNSEEGYLRFATNNVERITILNNGNVGIGTTTPSSKLEVNGGIEIDNLFNRNGGNFFGFCGIGQSIRVIDSNGGVTCEFDDVGAGDNLGDHIATQNLEMRDFNINGVGYIGASMLEATSRVKLPANTCVERVAPFSGTGFAGALCNADEVATGGGVACSGATNSIRVSAPFGNAGGEVNGWIATCTQSGTNVAYAICCKFK